eukprot:CAMPEP_0183705926 /NCGR_PEP_ID=MMETSP0737-20130205/2887_1 /TAXON_ID=385413 /ORGANISM="Thalassiosira miniscula, Strain CCMP1093" /LENGTH=486 /DNA_ID=CAMNT_0025933193 /DNA_START=73 /DNA_END=1533 /DNA_ORIENTATION=-
MGRRQIFKVIALCCFGFAAVVLLVGDTVSSPLRRETRLLKKTDIFLPQSLDTDSQRVLSLNLGNGNCKWQPPTYDVPAKTDTTFQKTVVAGFPSGDKRMIYIQMEALTGWPAKDEWDFEFLGDSNHPFIKANYPHHEGIWGWGSNADQVVLMVRNIRRSMVEYHDILWDIGYAKTWEEATSNLDQLYSARPPLNDFEEWRDLRVLDEAHWYGWFIDYWMEGGLMRDVFTHNITTPEHWNMLMMPGAYTKEELDYDLVVGPDTVVTPSYDPHCTSGEVTEGCKPKAVISAEKLRDYTEGPAETAAIANVLLNDYDGMGQYVIAQEAWDCIWRELIQNGKGLKTVYDRPGLAETDYSFSAEMLEEMIHELNRLIDKYGSDVWNDKPTANRIVELLVEHGAAIQIELDEVNSGSRLLRDSDFLGPKERERRRITRIEGKESESNQEKKDYSDYFRALEEQIKELRVKKMRGLAGKNSGHVKSVEPSEGL